MLNIPNIHNYRGGSIKLINTLKIINQIGSCKPVSKEFASYKGDQDYYQAFHNFPLVYQE